MAYKMNPKSPLLQKQMSKAVMTNKKTGDKVYKGGYSFDEAFSDAKKSGSKEFTWKNKEYNTKTK